MGLLFLNIGLAFTILSVSTTMASLLSPELDSALNKKLEALGPKLAQIAALSVRMDEPLAKMIYDDPVLADMYVRLGELGCLGLDHILGLPIFATLVNDSNLDFSGRHLCNVSCRGECVPHPRDRNVAPVSFYAFSCKCKMSECDANGPTNFKRLDEWKIPGSRIVCAEDKACQCDQIDPSSKSKGYLCNWIGNVDTNELHFAPPPRLSFVRWCECCPYEYKRWPQNTNPKPKAGNANTN